MLQKPDVSRRTFIAGSTSATAAVAAVNLWLAIAPALIALLVLGGARYLSPRKRD